MKQKEKDRQVSLHKICPDDIGTYMKERQTADRNRQTERKTDSDR